MKKEEIIYIRIMSVAGLLAILVLLTVLGLGSGLYSNVADNINNNASYFADYENVVYNLYFYKGLDVFYKILFSVTIVCSAVGAAGILLRRKCAALFAKTGCIFSVITSLYVLIGIFCHNIKFAVAFVTGFYMDNAEGAVIKNMLGIKPIVISIIMIIFGVLCLLIIKSSGMEKLKVYASGDKSRYYAVIMPVLMGTVFFETVREILTGILCQTSNALDGVSGQVYGFITDYYFADDFLFGGLYVWIAVIAAIVLMSINTELLKKSRIKLYVLISGCASLFVIVKIIIYMLNPPRLFGYLTTNEYVCDITEKAYPMYMFIFLFDILIIVTLIYLMYVSGISVKKTLILSAAHICISVIAMIIGSFAGITGIYTAIIAADLLALIGCFYMAYISRSHH